MTVATAPRRKIPGTSSTRPVAAQARLTSSTHVWPALLLLASGAASLIYQVLWIKQLSLVVGVEVHAVAIGISAFFGGLALGGWVFGRRADHISRPYWLCAWLELGVAVLGIGTTLALGASAAPYAWLENHVGFAAWMLPLVLVGLPAFLMGGTLPVLTRACAPKNDEVGAAGGRLYAANTLGAIVGALIAAFVLISTCGVRGTALVAATVNGLVALGAWAGAHRQGQTRHLSPSLIQADSSTPASRPARLAMGLYALAGGLALGYEVVWSQAIVQFMSTRSFAFAIVLATYLAGLVIGSAWQAHRVDRIRDPWGALGLLISAAGLAALLLIAGLGDWLLKGQATVASFAYIMTDSDLAAMSARFALAALCIVFLPTLLLGAAFPLALRLAVDVKRVGRDMGAVVALNTLGGIAGTLLTGFVLVPVLGLIHTLAALAMGAAALGLIALAVSMKTTKESSRHSAVRWATLATFGGVMLAAWATPADRLATLLVTARGGTLASYEESHGGTVAVLEQQTQGRSFKRLYIQGVSNSGDTMTSLRYMRLQALLPLLIHQGEPKSALVIGLGTGITGGALLRYPGLETRVVAELLPAVVRAVPQFKGNYGIGSDPRVDIRVRDGRRELLRSSRQYDLITLEPPPPSAAGVVNLYSTDFYRLAAKRLQPGGIVAQWLPLPTQNADDTRSLVRSFLDVFPHATLWTTELHEMMLVGSMAPIELDVPTIQKRFAQADVAQSLREVGIDSASTLLATWVTDRKGLARFAGEAAPVTDDRPGIEYAPWVRREAFSETLDSLFEQMSDPPLKGADAAFATEVRAERQRLITFYSASLYAYEGNLEAWKKSMGRVMQSDGQNPYYRWLLGAGAPASASR